jgi:hypothetical protein
MDDPAAWLGWPARSAEGGLRSLVAMHQMQLEMHSHRDPAGADDDHDFWFSHGPASWDPEAGPGLDYALPPSYGHHGPAAHRNYTPQSPVVSQAFTNTLSQGASDSASTADMHSGSELFCGGRQSLDVPARGAAPPRVPRLPLEAIARFPAPDSPRHARKRTAAVPAPVPVYTAAAREPTESSVSLSHSLAAWAREPVAGYAYSSDDSE